MRRIEIRDPLCQPLIRPGSRSQPSRPGLHGKAGLDAAQSIWQSI